MKKIIKNHKNMTDEITTKITMYRTQVISLNIQSIGYDASSAVLEVEFTSGDVYQYFNIPEHLYQQFLHASSHGQFLADNIRYNYRYQKIK